MIRHPPPLKYGRALTRRKARLEKARVRSARLFIFRALAHVDGPCRGPHDAAWRWAWARDPYHTRLVLQQRSHRWR